MACGLIAWCSGGTVPGSKSRLQMQRRAGLSRRHAADVLRAAEVAVELIRRESTGGRAALREALEATPTEDLETFCMVKGMRVREDVSRAELLEFAERYSHDEALSRRRGSEFDALSDKKKQSVLHRVCCGEGGATYLDPATDYTVFSAFWHLKRGSCCGIQTDSDGYQRTHRCRHCPYAQDGSLTNPAFIEVRDNIPVIEAVRDIVQDRMDSYRETLVAGGDAAVATENCEKCNRTGVTKCKRCNGFKYVFSPISQICPQCDGEGTHPCIHCTAWRPKLREDFT